MSEKRYKRFYVSESENQLSIYDNEGLDDYYHLGNDERDVKGICELLNELFEHNLHLQRLIESLAEVSGESIEDMIERYTNNKEIYTTSKRPMRFVCGRKI